MRIQAARFILVLLMPLAMFWFRGGIARAEESPVPAAAAAEGGTATAAVAAPVSPTASAGLEETPAPEPTAGDISVIVTGLRSERGVVRVSLYASPEGFPNDATKSLVSLQAGIVGGQARVVFRGVEPGTYAVSVLHDENNNRKLDTNFLGMPTEGVGSTNRAQGRLGPPRYEDSTFEHGNQNTHLKLSVTYLF